MDLKEFIHINSLQGMLIFTRLEDEVMKSQLGGQTLGLQTVEELLERDDQREMDGFDRKIKLGKLLKPGENGSNEIVIVPTTIETKFYHDNSVTLEDEQVGGVGAEEEGDVLGEKRNAPESPDGNGVGPGNGGGKGHDLNADVFNLGKVLTEHFDLPNLTKKGEGDIAEYSYHLTDLNKGFGQLIDKKRTLKKVIKTNILLGNKSLTDSANLSGLIHSPQDNIYKILSREVNYESEAVVFFVRDYSGSMQGKASEAVLTQHLFLYSWLMYQYNKRVTSKFILHDTDAKEVEDFNTYYRLNVAGGTQIHPAFSLVNSIIENEQLYLKKNIYVFYGSDGDDWKDADKTLIKELKMLSAYANRIGILVAKNTGGDLPTSLESNLEESQILAEFREQIVLRKLNANEFTEDQIVESIKSFLKV